MGDICPRCGLPKDICACSALEKADAQRIKVYTTRARYRKLVTIIEGVSKDEMSDLTKDLKRKLACGGSAKDDHIVLQGDHKRNIKQILAKMGYNPDSIDVR